MGEAGVRFAGARHGVPVLGGPGGFVGASQAAARAARLAALHPGLVAVRQVGTSRGGRPLVLLSVGDGPRHVLAVGGPHPNEPVGTATALHLAERAVHEPRLRRGSSVTWNFLLCLDPDGAALTEGWLRGPLTMERHYRYFYRPAVDGQPEWLPPPGADWATLPETTALTGVIDELRPFLQCSLHGVDVGGSFVQLTGDVPGLAEPFARSAAAAGVPLERGPYDAFRWPSPGPGTYLMPSAAAPADGSALTEDPACSTWSHAQRYGAVTAVVEVPMWAAPVVSDRAPSADPERALAAAARTLRAENEPLAELLAQIRPLLRTPHGPLLRSVEWHLAVAPRQARDWEPAVAAGAGPLSDLTRADLAGIEIQTHRMPLRITAMLARLLADAEGPAVGPLRQRVARLVAERCSRLRDRFGARWVPVRDQVGHQARTVVAVFDGLA
ncbi:M14 family zinc carboxypeptidase [Kitasatospora sp. NPDC059571]|uniref:M14 family zinc carboxypeptidase n=1 Tax=Kitasatospora sp. NPDC059571 TaxID=3346871 RepID=UPI0036891FD6